MNIIVIDRFYAERRANGLNWKSADRPDDNRKECKERYRDCLERKLLAWLWISLYVLC